MKRRPARIAAAFVIACSLLLSGDSRAQGSADVEALNAEIERLRQRVEELEQARISHAAAAAERKELERRIEELETEKVAHEEATRSIIRDTLSTLGSRINEFVVFGGVLEVLAGWGQQFDAPSEEVITLNTAELDFEIQVNDWVLGSLVVEYDTGTDTLFPTNRSGFELAVDRINIDTAFLTLGDTQRFWPFGTFGRMIVPFGISTGDPVADVLTLEDPLTVEVFETKEDAIFVGVELPTPAAAPLTPIPVPDPVRPQLLAPFVGWLARGVGYKPPPPPPPTPSYTVPIPPPPPFTAGVYFYNGETSDGQSRGWQPDSHIGATVGYRTRLGCTPYSERKLEDARWWDWMHFFCPATIEYDVDFNGSVFESLFLSSEYNAFLPEIGFIPGLAGSAKASLGPVGLVVEWNGALEHATFSDSLGDPVRIRPSAWQISLSYQFDWKPWVEAIGAQGTYVAIGYSESRDLAGVLQLVDGELERVGAVPRRRFLVDVGEWVLEGVRVAIEYAYIEDYPVAQGGTGKSANGVFSMLTFEW